MVSRGDAGGGYRVLGYDEIKELAKAYKATAKDFYYLCDDPYYMQGNPNERKKGEWFADLYQQYWHTLTDKMVRSLHYAILHHEVYLPDGKTRYINLDAHYEKLLEAAKVARYLGLVPMDIIDEKKNIPSVFIPQNKPLPKLDVDAIYWNAVELEPFPSVPHYDLTSFPDNQRYHLEIWCEKSYSSLRDLARKYNAVWQQSQGEQTVECANMLIERRKQYRKPVRVFYISDFDPAGTSMPAAVSRKLEFMLDDIRGKHDEPDVKLFNIALTQEQVERYNLPRTPLKSGEKRADVWQAIHGKDAVELNALEAQPQYKGELVRIVEDALKRYNDNELSVRAWRAQGKLAERLEGIQQDVYWDHPQLEMLRAEYERVLEEVAPKLERLNAEIQSTWERIENDLEERMPDLEEYFEEHPLPEAEMAQELENPLYDSNRDYFSQLAVYKQHQGKRIVF
jgi:hypothetical protein